MVRSLVTMGLAAGALLAMASPAMAQADVAAMGQYALLPLAFAGLLIGRHLARKPRED